MTRYTPPKALSQMVPDMIVGLLKREPMWTVPELANELGFSESGIRNNLKRLMKDGKAHFVEVRRERMGGLSQFWNLGPFPPDQKLTPRGRNTVAKVAIEAADEDDIDRAPPKQRIVTEWPSEPVRDPLLWALHKPVTEAA